MLGGLCFDPRERRLQSPAWRSTVRAKEGTELSIRLRTFTRSRWIEALFAVHLPEETLAATNLGAVFRVVGRLLVRQHVAQRRVGCQGSGGGSRC